jgi:ankyrin repeat protein
VQDSATPLWIASWKGRVAAMAVLLKAGADMEAAKKVHKGL